MKNASIEIGLNKKGCLTKFRFLDDRHNMNWVIDEDYLKESGYEDLDKLFGEFEIVVDGKRYTSLNARDRKITQEGLVIKVNHIFSGFEIHFRYDLGKNECSQDMLFKVTLKNTSDKFLIVDDFRIWTAFSYIMFKDTNVRKNMDHSCATFPSVSKNYSKIALYRRSNWGPHLGMYQLRGETKSVGSYCDFNNLFFENVSPSLDGCIFYQLVLAGGYYGDAEPKNDWIYDRNSIKVDPFSKMQWSYALCEFSDLEDFYKVGLRMGHPYVDYDPMAIVGRTIEACVKLPPGKKIDCVVVKYRERLASKSKNSKVKYKLGKVKAKSYTDFDSKYKQYLRLPVKHPGEHKVEIVLSDGTQDCFVVNVMDELPKVLKDRADYICDVLYQGPNGDVPYCFSPVSNQGESIGKLNLVLKTNLLSRDCDVEQVRKVEASAVNYIRPKWFQDGDFNKPVKLYGDFYRVMDYEYIAHTYLLLSYFTDDVLALNDSGVYLDWALKVFEMRVNPDLHDDVRGKEETQMLGVFFLYALELLEEVKNCGARYKYEECKKLWSNLVWRVCNEADDFKGAMTEIFYDNAGFGPSAGALAMNGHGYGASKYANLLLANIGFSNDFRCQNPDRWWEALSYMVHSLWGGISAASMLKVYEWSGDYRHLEAAYRATVAILYCYDTNATSTDMLLSKGEAASTYSTSGPLVNFPKLSRNRFGQSVFAELGGIHAKLFQNDDSTMDWDMGEELTAYLDGFGTKTFVYEKSGNIYVINGTLEAVDKDKALIRSYAPFPREYHYVDRHLHYVCPIGKYEDKIMLTKHGFEKIK